MVVQKPWVLSLHWTLLTKRGNQEKSDKQKNGGTKKARAGLWLVLAGSPLFISIAGGFSRLCVFLLGGPKVLSIVTSSVYAAELKRSFWANRMGDTHHTGGSCNRGLAGPHNPAGQHHNRTSKKLRPDAKPSVSQLTDTSSCRSMEFIKTSIYSRHILSIYFFLLM